MPFPLATRSSNLYFGEVRSSSMQNPYERPDHNLYSLHRLFNYRPSYHLFLFETLITTGPSGSISQIPIRKRCSNGRNNASSRHQKPHRPRNFPLHQPLHPKTYTQTHRCYCQNKMLRPQSYGLTPTRRPLPCPTSSAQNFRRRVFGHD